MNPHAPVRPAVPASVPAPVPAHVPVLVIGGGQAGLSVSHYLGHAGIGHVVLERETALHAWRDQRWDHFTLVTPNWQCALPGHPYDGDDPHGFMNRGEILDYLERFAARVRAPLREGVAVERLYLRDDGRFEAVTSAGRCTADQVVVASGGYQQPVVPRCAERLPAGLVQLHSAQYRNAAALPPGAVMVVGSGQSGAQIAEDLHLAGRQVHLATGDAPRCARFYRGRDVVDWLADMGYYDLPVHEHPLREGVRDNTNHYVTGRDGGRDIDLRRFALEGMRLYGQMLDVRDGTMRFAPNLGAHLDAADATYNRINASIDEWIAKLGLVTAEPASTYQPLWTPPEEAASLDLAGAGITSVIWCIGYRADYGWIDAPVFNGRGHPAHVRGVTPQPGLYFIGLPWLHTWGSGRFSGVGRDAEYLSARIGARLAQLAGAAPEALAG
ncbi:MSMEG_0569 family flavin-dependent oxidoreductase [Plasticicumulans sp.]|uniref:MSMEG_0569 family flavin-dependent oxidoreductase n=1 Tax=Plasticicumulans sp. TaxID=2307179 RepID=UPI00321FBCDA